MNSNVSVSKTVDNSGEGITSRSGWAALGNIFTGALGAIGDKGGGPTLSDLNGGKTKNFKPLTCGPYGKGGTPNSCRQNGTYMKAINKKNGKEVGYWIVSHDENKPEWIKRLFFIGLLSWIDDNSVKYGVFTLNFGSARLSIGDVLVYKGKYRVENSELDYMTAENFYKKYKIISE